MSEKPVLSSSRLLVTYLVAVAALSSVTATFEWPSPLETPEGPWDWYRELGVRRGVLVAAGHAAPGGGWRLGLDRPRVMPLPLVAGAGPESGGLYVAPWFAVGAMAAGHFLLRARKRSREIRLRRLV